MISRLRSLKSGVARESKEAVSMLEAEFSKLQKVLKDQTAALEQSRKSKSLTKAESTLVETLGAAMTTAKQRVKKEVEDVEDIIE